MTVVPTGAQSVTVETTGAHSVTVVPTGAHSVKVLPIVHSVMARLYTYSSTKRHVVPSVVHSVTVFTYNST